MIDYSNYSDFELIELHHNSDAYATEALIKRYTWLVKSIARRFFIVGGDSDDIVQEGMIALSIAIQKFNSRGASFKTFAYSCVRSRILDVIKADNTLSSKILNTANSYDDLNAFIEGANFEDDIFNKVQYKMLVEEINDSISEVEQDILRLYSEGMKYSDIANVLGKTSKQVDNALQKIKRAARDIVDKWND